MESKVFSFVVSIISRLSEWFNESKCGALSDKFAAMCYRIYSTSAVCRFFRTSKNEGKLQNSFLGKIVGIPAQILMFLQRKFATPLNRILKESAICTSFKKWADISARLYGIACCVFCVPVFVTCLGNVTAMILTGTLFVLGLVMVLVNRSVRQLFGGSAIVKALLELFIEPNTKTHTCQDCTGKQMVTAAISGLMLSVLCMVLGVRNFTVITAGILAFAFMVRYLQLGIFLTVVLSPMLPTMALVGLSLLCTMVFCLHVVTTEGFRFVKTPMNTFVIFFALALVWGCINSFSVISSASQVAVHLSFILFYFIIVNSIRDKRQWNALIKLFLASAFIVAVYGVMQNFLGIRGAESWLDEEMFSSIKIRVYSFFNNPNVLGEFLVMTIPVVIALVWGKAREEHKALYGFILICMAACMIFTWSRGAWLGVFFACALFFVIMDKRWVFLGVLALFLLPLLLVMSGNTAIVERLLSVGNTSDTSTAYRVSIWQASFKMIRDFWISGIGIGSDAYKAVYPAYSLAGADFALHSHNLYLQVWVEMGMIGIVSLASMILMYIKQVFSSAVMQVRKTSNSAKLVIALGVGIIGYLLQGLTDYVWYNYKILMIFWIVIALGISGANLVEQTVLEKTREET